MSWVGARWPMRGYAPQARRALAAVLLLTLTASSPLPLPDVIGAGRVAANLSDVQTILYFLMVLIVCLLVERWASGWQSRSTADKFAKAANVLSDAMKADGAQTTVQLALVQKELSDVRTAQATIIRQLDQIIQRPG
jgi:hypothetical protein